MMRIKLFLLLGVYLSLCCSNSRPLSSEEGKQGRQRERIIYGGEVWVASAPQTPYLWLVCEL